MHRSLNAVTAVVYMVLASATSAVSVAQGAPLAEAGFCSHSTKGEGSHLACEAALIQRTPGQVAPRPLAPEQVNPRPPLLAPVPEPLEAVAQNAVSEKTHPRIATFSFVAVDTAAQIAGVIVASKFFSVGSVVPWGRGDVGAIATQSFANTSFGPRGLDLLATGATPEETMQILLRDDTGRDQRQVGIVDAEGHSATYTGASCMAWAGGRSGPGFAAQGNILTGPEVVDRMVESFEQSEGRYLGDRLLAALEAGDAAGGDSRGRQSAALLLVATGQGYGGFNDRLCQLNVDDHADPIGELRRLYRLWRPNQLIFEGYRLVEDSRYDDAIAKGKEAAELDPDSGEPFYHLACYYARAGRLDDAIHYLEWAVRLAPRLKTQAATDTDLTPVRARTDYQQRIGS